MRYHAQVSRKLGWSNMSKIALLGIVCSSGGQMLSKRAKVEKPVADVLSLRQRLPQISQLALSALLKISPRDRQIREATR